MKISSKFVSILFISALGISMAFAQGGGQRGGGQGGRGAQRGGQQMSELRLLGRKDVQKDLALTDDQVTKIEEYTTKNQPQRGAGGAGGAGGGGNGGGQGGGGQRGGGGQGGGAQTEEQRAAAAKLQAERREKTRKELLEIISEAQMKRVGEIMLQLQGFSALGQPEMQKALVMTEDQIAKVKALQTQQREANTALFQKVQSQEMTREDVTAAMAKNTETLKAELGKILTADQAGKFKTMQGKTFTADEPGK